MQNVFLGEINMNLNKALWKLNYFFSLKSRKVDHKYSEKMIELFKNNDVSDYHYSKKFGKLYSVTIDGIEFWTENRWYAFGGNSEYDCQLNAEAAWHLWQKVKPILEKCNEERFK